VGFGDSGWQLVIRACIHEEMMVGVIMRRWRIFSIRMPVMQFPSVLLKASVTSSALFTRRRKKMMIF